MIKPDKKPKFKLFDKVFVDCNTLCQRSLITGVAYNPRSGNYRYEIDDNDCYFKEEQIALFDENILSQVKELDAVIDGMNLKKQAIIDSIFASDGDSKNE